MARSGIRDYEPEWLNGRDSITAVHGRRPALNRDGLRPIGGHRWRNGR